MCAVYKNIACLERLKKQKKFLKSKGKDMVCYSLKTLNKLEKAKEKEKQIKEKHAANKATANLFYALVPKANPFAKIKIPLLPLGV